MAKAIRVAATFSSADLAASVGSRRESPRRSRSGPRRGACRAVPGWRRAARGGRVVKRALAVIALAGVALVLALGRGSTTGQAADPNPPANRVDLGVVAVEARVGGDAVHSSGTVVDADRGLVLTSARAVWGATSLKLATGLGILHGRIVARAPCDELALVETQPRVPGLISLADRTATPPASGALVTAYGRRLAKPGSGMLAVPARVANAPLMLDALLVPEAAGGPILDSGGRLVGIAAPAGG